MSSDAGTTRLPGWLEATRPGNVAMVGFAVLIGGLIAGTGRANAPMVSTAVISAMLIAAAGNVDNDRCDVAIDRLNRPGRPLPSGRLTDRTAGYLAFGGAALGLLLAGGLGWRSGAVAMLVVVALGAYNRVWKRLPLIGNLAVAVIVALSLVYGGLIGAQPGKTLVAALLAGLMTLGREILKDIEDLSGDSALGLRTLPVAFGRRVAVTVVIVVLGLTVLASLIPLWHDPISTRYAVLVVGVDGIVVAVAILLGRDSSPASLRRLSTLLKLAMLVGLIALM